MSHDSRAQAVIYEVGAVVQPDLCASYEKYMTEEHIPDLMRTGCFTNSSFHRSGEGEYRSQYIASSRENLDEYLRDHAPRLRGEFAAHFPDGIALSRQEWILLREYAHTRD